MAKTGGAPASHRFRHSGRNDNRQGTGIGGGAAAATGSG
ncbi:hypothetical protein [Aminobacter aminovorans]